MSFLPQYFEVQKDCTFCREAFSVFQRKRPEITLYKYNTYIKKNLLVNTKRFLFQ